MPTERLDRYKEIIPSWEAFLAACERPLPPVIRTNTLRCAPQALTSRLEAMGVSVDPYPWEPALVRLNRSVSRTLEHWLGLFYVQEATQAVPVLALDPQPGETVLDLCAAPGGKTTHIAARMKNRGTLVANEPNGRRQQALLANINRVGAVNITVTQYRGESFPHGSHFDRVLVDAPCSAEGTLRKQASLRNGATQAAISRLARMQERLILHGFDLLRSDGVLVYSTCTLAPEENEAIVARLLSERDAVVRPPDLHVPACPGLTEWNGTRFPDQLANCRRIYPHHFDSGGGFVARIERAV